METWEMTASSALATAHGRRPRICIVAHAAYGAMTGGKSGHIGGVERQTSLMAKWFAGRGYQVSMLTWNEGGPAEEMIDGVRVIKLCRQNAGVKGLRFFWPSWTSLISAMKRADADIYYQNCGEYVTGQVALWCRRHGCRFVYSVACDTDCDRRLPEMHKLRERILYRYGLKAADRVIVQTEKQQKMLRAGFGRESVVIPMPCPGPSEDEYADHEQAQNGSPRVLWIGRICKQKRTDWLLDLAETCPDMSFDLVGPAAETDYSRAVCGRATTLPNVTLHGPAPRDRVSEFYRKARVMCCTSDFEGFPNTFLEAWSWGVPIVSTFDPDNLIAERGLGRVGKDISELATLISELLESPEKWGKASQSARAYYVDHHAVDVVLPRFEQVFTEICGPA